MARQPVGALETDRPLQNDNEIDSSFLVEQEQLKNAKIFTNRETYVKTLPQGIRYMEVGVAWGYYTDLVINAANPSSVTLLDKFDQDLKCWSWRKFGECKCEGMKHVELYTPETHLQYMKDKYKDIKNFETIEADSVYYLPKMAGVNEYDYIYLDITNWRHEIRPTLRAAAKLVPVGGLIGLNDYLIYDGIIEDAPYATYQVTNEFLHRNKNWEVDAIALHPLGFYDIYLRKVHDDN